MQSFDELPRPVQLRRMRRLAQSALVAYAIGEVQLTPIQHFLNTTFRVDVPTHKERYVLRISGAGYQEVAPFNRSCIGWGPSGKIPSYLLPH